MVGFRFRPKWAAKTIGRWLLRRVEIKHSPLRPSEATSGG